MAGPIICGVDDSESAKAAARFARSLSAQLGRQLVFVRVVEAGSPDKEISAVAERLQHLTECGIEVDCGADWRVEVGHPADRLVAAAANDEASLIVVGSTGTRSSLLGSISAEVSRRAPCPVVIVPPGADERPTNGHGPTEFAGGIARFGLGTNGSKRHDPVTDDPVARDFAGGIVRFSLGSYADES